jgi:hypothetical protein
VQTNRSSPKVVETRMMQKGEGERERERERERGREREREVDLEGEVCRVQLSRVVPVAFPTNRKC